MKKKYFFNTKTREQHKAVSEIVYNFGCNEKCALLFNGKNKEFSLINNLSELSDYLSKKDTINTPIINNTLPIWNSSTMETLKEMGLSKCLFLASFELSKKELTTLKNNEIEDFDMILPIYGHIPVMVTKNCIKKTKDKCDKKTGFTELKDRKNVTFFVYSDCEKCMNTIYNSVPLSLHNHIRQNHDVFRRFYFDFTKETPKECEEIIDYYFGNAKNDFPIKNFTTGHFNKPVL